MVVVGFCLVGLVVVVDFVVVVDLGYGEWWVGY